MRAKAIAVLGLCTLLAVGAAAWSVYWRNTSHALPPAPAALFPGLLDRVNDVAKVAVASSEASFTVVKGADGTWSMAERANYPVTYETVKQAVVGLANMKPIEAKTARPERFAKLKLLAPEAEGKAGEKGVELRLFDGKGQEIAAVIVGKTRSVQTKERDGWYYVRKPEVTQSWLASARLQVWEKRTSWLDDETVRIDRNRIRAAGNKRPDGAAVELSRPSPEKTDFKVDNLPEGQKMIHDTAANNLGSALGFMSFDDVARADAIDFHDAVVATFRTFDGLVVTVELVKRDDKNWARFSAAFDPDEVKLDAVPEKYKDKMKAEAEVKAEVEQINRRFAGWAYNVPQYKADDFLTPMSKLAVEDKPGAS